MKPFLQCLFLLLLIACQPKKTTKPKESTTANLKYAKMFYYTKHKKFTKVIVKTPYKNATTPYEYFIITGDTLIEAQNDYQFVIKEPIQKLVATSTTQIPMLEAIACEHLLKGFPNTQFISSKKTRALIDAGKITDLGQQQEMNTELVLNLQPDAILAFGVNELNKNLNTLKKAGISLIIDASWLEESPLGRAEWVKFFALFLGKEKEANTIFNQIENSYLSALKAVETKEQKPSMLYGSMFQGIWYAPAGESYMAQILKDAQVDYLWKNTPGTGSLSLPFEKVYLQAEHTLYWFAPGMVTDLNTLAKINTHYTKLTPFKNQHIYTYANATGDTGGLLFFELGALRPDFILKDIIQICHPKTLPNYKATFFTRLE